MRTSDSAPALVDTNVLVYASDATAPQHEAACALRNAAVAGELSLCVTAQILFEYVSVVTNPKRVASPATTEAAWAEVKKFAEVFQVLPTPGDLFERVRPLVSTVKPKGRELFDLALAVTALSGGVTVIYTFDDGVFARVPGMTVKAPTS